MAKYKGFLKVEGSLGPITMYQLQGKWVVRQRFGPDAMMMQTHKNYAAQQKHGKEFGAVSRASKLLRDGFRGLISGLGDPQLHGRMTKTMHAIKNMDPAPNGERRVALGLQTAEGRAMLRGWNGNVNASVPGKLVDKAAAALESGLLELDLAEVNGGKNPMELHVVWLVVDFELGHCKAESAEPVLLTHTQKGSWQRPEAITQAKGIPFLAIGFWEMLPSGMGWVKSEDRKRKGLVLV